MKLIIAGGRDLVFRSSAIADVVRNFNLEKKITEIVSGGANGIDFFGGIYAEAFQIPLKTFHADWETFGKAAGPIRNKQMAEYADALLLIWDGKSKGSANMKKQMQVSGKPIYEVILKGIE